MTAIANHSMAVYVYRVSNRCILSTLSHRISPLEIGALRHLRNAATVMEFSSFEKAYQFDSLMVNLHSSVSFQIKGSGMAFLP